jgi:hypothetical protein
MKIIDIHLDHHNFFCPVTGAQITSDDAYEPSPAQVGMFHYEVPEEPEIHDPSLQALWDTYVAKTEDLDLDEFLDSVDHPTWVAYKITTSGMACGPVSSTWIIVIDMNYEADEDE